MKPALAGRSILRRQHAKVSSFKNAVSMAAKANTRYLVPRIAFKPMRLLPPIILLCAAVVNTHAQSANLTIVSAANSSASSLAPESIATAFGTNLPPQPEVMVTDSAGAARSATLFYYSDLQINFQIPPGTAIGPATVTINSSSSAVAQATVNIVAVSPGFFPTATQLVVTAPDLSQTTTPIEFRCGLLRLPRRTSKPWTVLAARQPSNFSALEFADAVILPTLLALSAELRLSRFCMPGPLPDSLVSIR